MKKSKNESRKILWEKRKKEKICVYCGKLPAENDKAGCTSCLNEKVKTQANYDNKYKEKQVLYRKRIRKFVIDKYGGKCVCCGEKEMLFLTMDHKNNDGYIERRKRGKTPSSFQFFLQLKKTPKRKDIQVLCFNCNLGRSMNGGTCPHHKPSLKNYHSNIDLRHNKKLNIGCKIKWPSDMKLIELVNKITIKKASKKLNVHEDSIRHRLQTRNLYHLINKHNKASEKL